jgi:hypothetical protein
MALTGIFGGKRGRLLVSGQTTQYSGELDDGFYEKGLTKTYTVLTTGAYSGTSNIDLIHLTDISIAFAATTPGTITDTNNQLAMFKTGEVIVVSGSVGNDGVYNVSAGGVAGTIRTTEPTILGAAGPSVSIAKREAHSNNCVLDRQTGLMWARYTSFTYATMGTAGDGKMPWTGELYDIFQYCAAANAASLSGYTDWRVANVFELTSLFNTEISSPNVAAFPGYPTANMWTSTTNNNSTATAYIFRSHADPASLTRVAKTTANLCALVRGGV